MTTDWYAPNQQAVRADESGPAESGDGGSSPPPEEVTPVYDPGVYTVAQVQDYVTANPDERAAVLAAEQAGKARATLLEWLAG